MPNTKYREKKDFDFRRFCLLLFCGSTKTTVLQEFYIYKLYILLADFLNPILLKFAHYPLKMGVMGGEFQNWTKGFTFFRYLEPPQILVTVEREGNVTIFYLS